MSNNWKTYNLGEIVDVKQGLAINKKTNHLLTKKSSMPLFKIRDLINNTVEHYVKENEVPKQCIANYEDLIYSRTGQVGLVFRGKIGCIHNNCFKIIPNESKVNKDLLFWFLRQPSIIEYANNIASGSVQKDLNHTAFKSIEISLSNDVTEQKNIADILNAIENKIENNLAINKTLEEMAIALYKYWFVDFGPFQAGEFVESELGLIPVGWEVGKLEDLLEIKYGKDHKNLKDGIIPVYGSGGIMRYANESLYDKESILIPRKGTLSNLFYVSQPFWSVDTMFYSKIKDSSFGKYTFYFLKSIDLASMDVGSAIPSLTTELLKRIEIVLPPKIVANEFNEMINSKFKIIESNIKENQTLTQLRDTLLPKLISGAVRVKEFNK